MVNNSPVTQDIRVRSLGWEDSMEKRMATHSSILVWRSPWTEEPGRLQSAEPQRQTWLRQVSMSKHCDGTLSTIYAWLCSAPSPPRRPASNPQHLKSDTSHKASSRFRLHMMLYRLHAKPGLLLHSV